MPGERPELSERPSQDVDGVREPADPGATLDCGVESGQVAGTPTLFIDRVMYDGGYDAGTITRVLAA